jgi:uncharacterized small protein (DUF1192 family)
VADTDLQAEVERLRAEVESYRQREVTELKSALAAVRDESAAWKAEAKRVSDVGRQLDAALSAEIESLKRQLEAALNSRRLGRDLNESRN